MVDLLKRLWSSLLMTEHPDEYILIFRQPESPVM